MTWWSPMEVRGFVRAAGWDREPARIATAIALASSGGADHYHWNSVDAPGLDHRGLFALELSRTDPDSPESLWDPHTNCEWAHALWAHYGRSWHWHPVWENDRGAIVRATLSALDESKNWTAKPAAWFARAQPIGTARSITDLLRSVPTTAGDQTPADQEALWPTPTP